TGKHMERYVSALLVFCGMWNAALSVTRYSIPEEMEEGSVVADLAVDLGIDVNDLQQRGLYVCIRSSNYNDDTHFWFAT
uniref:Cadherin N-terminal domain-containing protein n=1 Tax=Paramormyrops kingsleyae TaxID=1676925 RepID=A0A3B3RI13_9TELE